MPSRRLHRGAAARHLRAYRSTIKRFPDWAAVMLFYAALHILESAFDTEGFHGTTHGDREYYIKKRHGSVWPAYHRLQTESMKARYMHGGRFFMNARAVDGELRRRKLADVRAHVRTLLAPRPGRAGEG